MIYFSKYAEEKFDVLNAHKVFIRKEAVKKTILSPERQGKIGKLLTAELKGLKVVYQKEHAAIKIITFYPV